MAAHNSTAPSRSSQATRTLLLISALAAATTILIISGTVIFGFILARQLASDSRQDAARTHIKGTLAPAVAAYYIRNGEYPASLIELTQPQPDGGLPFIESRALTDPWGRPYCYESPGVHSTTGEPDIWSEGPSPGDPSSIIGNW